MDSATSLGAADERPRLDQPGAQQGEGAPACAGHAPANLVFHPPSDYPP